MKALVVRQPWATLIALGVKTIETRPAPPNGPMRPDGVRGLPGLPIERGERIAIVAGAQMPKRGECCGDWSVETWRDSECEPCAVHLGAPSLTDGPRSPISLPLGAVVCTVTVDDALPIVWIGTVLSDPAAVPWPNIQTNGPSLASLVYGDGASLDASSELPLGDFTPGRWGWLLSDPQPCDPIPCKGNQGVFALPDDVAAEVER